MAAIYELIASIGLRDVVDIGLLSGIIYWLLQLIKGTRTIPILLGMTVLLLAYAFSGFLRLEAISWLMEHLFGATVVILVVLFQADIRNALARLGISTMFRELSTAAQTTLIEEVVEATEAMVRRKMGGTIVLERETGLRNYMERGKPIMAEVSTDLLVSIFHTSSPLHDGAVIINREGKIAAARCILPLSGSASQSAFMGTRHRSGLGLSEETDAVVVIVSEERGRVSIAHRGKLSRDQSEGDLRRSISQLLQVQEQEDAVTEIPPQPKSA